ncbi:MAG: methyltransferase domain-containing protein [Pirellulales bacterium]
MPPVPIAHRDDEFNQWQLDVYAQIEPRHFWFAGRRRFLLHAVRRELRRLPPHPTAPSAVDLGGGCGGWIKYLGQAMAGTFPELALADSSLRALDLAGQVLQPSIRRYQVDLRQLGWSNRWDVAFLLDVLEHIRDDEQVLAEIHCALRPGGLLFVTAPALDVLRTYNDDLERHVRRYSRSGFQRLARRGGFELADARYFMFLLSPLLLASRAFPPDVERMSPQERIELYQRTHAVPPAIVNCCLRLVFGLETPLGHWVRFPWGTSILGVFRKPR